MVLDVHNTMGRSVKGFWYAKISDNADTLKYVITAIDNVLCCGMMHRHVG